MAGCSWLRHLQNNNGGFPTFSRSWGKLSFDRSCSDLTGHCLLVISSVLDTYSGALELHEEKMLKKMCRKALNYLEANQQGNGSWYPLWFGNQHTENFQNPVYGSARVTTYLKDGLTSS